MREIRSYLTCDAKSDLAVVTVRAGTTMFMQFHAPSQVPGTMTKGLLFSASSFSGAPWDPLCVSVVFPE